MRDVDNSSEIIMIFLKYLVILVEMIILRMKKVLFLTSTKTVFESEGHSPPQNITAAEKQVLTLTLKLVI